MVVFVRSVAGESIASGSGESQPAELWRIAVSGKEAAALLRTQPSQKMETLIAGFDDLQFSTDGRLLYFVTPAWTTSGAVHVLQLSSGKEHFVLAGNNLDILTAGQYRDCLLVQQHRYFVGAGSYDWFWLFRPNGTEVGPIGEETENFKSVYLE